MVNGKLISHNHIEFEVYLDQKYYDKIVEWFPYNEDENCYLGHKYDSKKHIATFSTSLVRYIWDMFCNFNIPNNELTTLLSYTNNKIPLDVSDDKVGTGKLKPIQYECVKNIAKNNSGLIQAETGFGKNVIITYIITHYRGKGNILIIAPTISILNEIKQRAKLFDVEFDEERVRAVHAAGFVNSKYKNNKEWTSFMKDVELILIDESENITSSIEIILREHTVNYKYIFGFSATANKYEEMKLDYNTVYNKFYELEIETVSLLYFLGYSIFYHISDKPINIIKYWDYIEPEQPLPYWQQKREVLIAEENAFKSEGYINAIKYIRKAYPDKILFVPVRYKKYGKMLIDIFADDKVAFWDASGIITSKGYGKDIADYAQLKEEMDSHKINILAGTSVAYRGVDFKYITDTLLLLGANNSLVNQCLGRCLRTTDDVRVWLLYNKSDKYVDYRKQADQLSTPIFDALNGSKIKKIKLAHPKVNIIEIDNEIRVTDNSENINPFDNGD